MFSRPLVVSRFVSRALLTTKMPPVAQTMVTRGFPSMAASPQPQLQQAPKGQAQSAPKKAAKPKKLVRVNWLLQDGETVSTTIEEGMTILEAAHANDIELEGACEASLACSTCHVVLEETVYDKLNSPVEDEWDMIDLAFGLTKTSRLGCQVPITSQFEGATITLPKCCSAKAD